MPRDQKMEPLWDALGSNFLKRIEKELGHETTLRLLWALVVGSQLAANTRLKAVHGGTLVVGVPDRGWLKSLGPLDAMILDAVNRWSGDRKYTGVTFVEDPEMPLPPQAPKPTPVRALADPGIDASAIRDEALRAVFMASAKKYFAQQSARQAEPKLEPPAPNESSGDPPMKSASKRKKN